MLGTAPVMRRIEGCEQGGVSHSRSVAVCGCDAGVDGSVGVRSARNLCGHGSIAALEEVSGPKRLPVLLMMMMAFTVMTPRGQGGCLFGCSDCLCSVQPNSMTSQRALDTESKKTIHGPQWPYIARVCREERIALPGDSCAIYQLEILTADGLP